MDARDSTGNPNFREIAKKIDHHLFEQELTLGPNTDERDCIPQKPRQGPERNPSGKGLIEKRAQSIESSVYPSSEVAVVGQSGQDWSPADEAKYSKDGIAENIFAFAKKKDGERGRLTTSDVGRMLFDHYERVGLKRHNVAEDPEVRGLLALHEAVRAFYKTKIRTNKRGRDGAPGKLTEVLPRTSDQLFKLLAHQDENRRVTSLIRKGRNIFYRTMAAAENDTGRPQGLPNVDFEHHFRTSEGQAAIKRSEAFVRVWRNVLSQAGRTAKAWSDPEGPEGDVFDDQVIQDLTGNNFNRQIYDAKLDVIFGAKSSFFRSDDLDAEKNILKAALRIGLRLRRVVHFYDRKAFVRLLEDSIMTIVEGHGKPENVQITSSTQASICRLLDTDRADRNERLIKDLKGVLLHEYAESDQIEELVTNLKSAEISDIPLPRFNRLLNCHDGTRGLRQPTDDRRFLPERANSRKLNKPDALCKFACMKLLYEKLFGNWLTARSSDELKGMIEMVLTEGAVRARVPQGRSPFKLLIRSKAENLPDLGARSLAQFFDDLAREVAVENRHQNAYEPNPEAAREQSEWIEDFKCDLIAIAFGRFLRREGFGWLMELPSEALPVDRQGGYPKTATGTETPYEPWEANLYFFLHLVPIDDVSRLIHQLRKTAVLDRKASEDADNSVKRLQDLLSLYMDMHGNPPVFNGVVW